MVGMTRLELATSRPPLAAPEFHLRNKFREKVSCKLPQATFTPAV
jgi:hypothetical protein